MNGKHSKKNRKSIFYKQNTHNETSKSKKGKAFNFKKGQIPLKGNIYISYTYILYNIYKTKQANKAKQQKIMSKVTLDVNKTGNFMNKQTKQMTFTLAKTF